MPQHLSKIRKLLVVVGMLVPVLLLIGVGIMLGRSHRSMLASSQWISHTLEVESKLARLRFHIAEAESAHRGFLLTRRPEFLESFTAAVAKIPPEEKDLLAITADNAPQQQRLKQLTEAITAKTGVLQQTLSLASSGRQDEAMRLFNSESERQLMVEIHRLINAAATEEEALLQMREGTMAGKSALHANISYTLIGFAGLTVASVLLLLWHMQRAQALITVCAWSKTIEHEGEWLSFEDYMQKRFGLNISHGISPEEAVKFTASLPQRRKKAA